MFFNVYDNDDEFLHPPGIDMNSTVFITDYTPPKQAVVLEVPFDESDVYRLVWATEKTWVWVLGFCLQNI